MNDDRLTDELAAKILSWRIAPGRYLTAGRSWIPRWRFRPFVELADAFQLLEKATPQEYSICGDDAGNIHVRVRIAGRVGEAHGTSRALAITQAIARAVGIEVGSSVSPTCPVKHPSLRRHSSPSTQAADANRRGQL